MAAMQFFVMDELTGQQTGPYSLQQIQEQILNRKLKKNDFVRRADSPNWGKASVILGQVFDNVERHKKDKKQQLKTDKAARKQKKPQANTAETKERQFQGAVPQVRVASGGNDRSSQPLLGLIDSLIEIKQSREPKRMDEDAADKWYEYSVYVFIATIILAIAFQIFSSVVMENVAILIAGIIMPFSLLWFLIGIWGIRKTTHLVQANNVMISTNLPAGLTNLLFRLIGAAFIAFGAVLVVIGTFGVLMELISLEDAKAVEYVLPIWMLLTMVLPTSVGSIFVGYVFWKPGTTLANMESCGVTKTDEVVSICNEFLASVIIQIKNLYEKAPSILLVCMIVLFCFIFSFTSSALLSKLLIDEANFEEILGGGLSEVAIGLLTYASAIPLIFWFYSIVGILFVELALAVLACGRLAIRRLQQ